MEKFVQFAGKLIFFQKNLTSICLHFNRQEVIFMFVIFRYKGSRRSNTYRHIQGVHLKIKVYQCNMCDFGNEKMGLLKEHFQNIHKDGNLNENILSISQEDKYIPLEILNKLDGTVCKVCR